MRVIIPAAGRGTRLQPWTNFSPKCLIEINGKPLLYYLLHDLKQLNVSEVIIITGYLDNMIDAYVKSENDFPKVTCVFNKDFESSNSIVSVALSRKWWDEDFCIIDSDLLLKQSLLKKMLAIKGTSLIIDSTKSLDQIDMKVKVENNMLVYMDKYLLRKETSGEFFGLSKWSPESAKSFSKTIDNFLEKKQSHVWYEFAIREMAKETKIHVTTCSSGSWFEIDNPLDLEIAQLFHLSNSGDV